METATNELTDKRIHATHRLVEGRVCGACNNGWMSRLEESAKPTLIELIENRRGVWEIGDQEASIVAKWAVKTAYVLANVSKGNKPVQPEHIACLNGDTGLVPNAVGVFGFQFSYDRQNSYFQTGRWPQVIREVPHLRLHRALRRHTRLPLQHRHLHLLLAYWPHQPSQFVVAAGVQVPIWPRRPSSGPRTSHPPDR